MLRLPPEGASLSIHDSVELVDVFERQQVLTEQEMQETRGTFRVGGFDMSFGANVRTLVDGVSLETRVALTEAGIDVSGLTSSISGSLVDGDAVNPNPVSASNGVNVSGGGSLPNGAQVNLPDSIATTAGGTQLVINDAKGFTSVLHNITRDRIQTTLVNAASSRNVEVDVEVEVTIHNFTSKVAATRQGLLRNQILTQVHNRLGL